MSYSIPATTRPTDRPRAASLATRDPYRRLASAILANGATAAKRGDRDALGWLLSEQAEFLADNIGLSYEHVKRWANKERQKARSVYSGVNFI